MSSTLNVKLVSAGRPVPFGAFVRVAFNQDTDEQAYSQHYTDPAGTVAFEFTPPGQKRIYPHAPGFTAAPLDVVMPHDDQIVIEMAPVAISSSELRARVARGGSIAADVPGRVAGAIARLGLYSSPE